MKKAMIFFLIVCCFPVTAQESDSLRDIYIKRYPDHFALWPVLKRRTLTFQVAKDNDRRKKLSYIPNNSYSVGVGAYLFDIAFELAFAIPLDEKSHRRYGESDARDIQINALGSNFGVDLYHQKYEGFYIDDPSVDYSTSDAYPQRGDIRSRNFGVTGMYVFSGDKLSFKSAFNFAERQLRSGGSFLVSGALNSFKANADSAVLNMPYRSEFGAGATFEDLRYSTFSIAPGYAHNVVFRSFFINAAFMIGPAHNWITYRNDNQSEKNDISFNSFTVLRVGLGYNGNRFFAGLNFISQSRSVSFDNIYFTNSSNTFRLLAGYRFRESGFLKRSVWDIPGKLF